MAWIDTVVTLWPEKKGRNKGQQVTNRGKKKRGVNETPFPPSPAAKRERRGSRGRRLHLDHRGKRKKPRPATNSGFVDSFSRPLVESYFYHMRPAKRGKKLKNTPVEGPGKKEPRLSPHDVLIAQAGEGAPLRTT